MAQQRNAKRSLLDELEQLRHRNAELEAAIAGRGLSETALENINSAEAALRLSEDRFRSIIESSPMGMFFYHLHRDGRLVLTGANPAADRILGLDTSQFVGNTIEEAFPPLAQTEVPGQYKRLCREGGHWRTEQIDYEDEQISGAFEVHAFQTAPARIAVMFLDITRRKRAEARLQEAEARYRTLIEHAPEAIFVVDIDTLEILATNRNVERILRISQEQAKQLGPSGLAPEFQPDGKPSSEHIREHVAALRRGEEIETEWTMVSPARDNFLTELRIVLLPSTDRRTVRASVIDISARKQAEAALKEGERRYRALFESANDAIFLMEGDTFIDCNPKTLEIFHCTRDQIIGASPARFSPPMQPDGAPSVDKGFEKINRALKGGRQFFEWRHRRLDGTEFDVEVSLNPVTFSGKRYVQAIVRDVTDRIRAEKALRFTSEFRRLITTVSARFVRLPSEAAIDGIQQALREIGEFAEVDRSYAVLFSEDHSTMSCVSEWSRAGIYPRIREFQDISTEPYPWWMDLMRRGKVCYVHALSQIPESETTMRQQLVALGVGSFITVPLVYGSRVVGFLGWAAVRRRKKFSEGNINLLRVVGEIIASALERRSHERNLKAATKAAEAANDAKSQFLANMSHEVRTPLNGILGMTNILLDTSLEAPQREVAETVWKSANALLQIVNDILDISKIEYGRIDIEKIPFNLQVTLEDLVELMAPAADRKGIDLTLWFGPDTPRRLIGDPGRIRQILLNLVGNAIKFTEAGHVLLEVTCVGRDSGQATLELAVHDTGPGIPAEQLPLLFRKFTQLDSSSTRKYEGTGLGLAISEHLTTLMGGEITVNSENGSGSTFTVRLPLELDRDVQPPEIPAEELKDVRILVVDEDHLRRTTMVDRCTGWSMRVTAADSGRSALDFLAQATRDNDPFSLVLLDRRLPDLRCERFVSLARQNADRTPPPIILLASVGERGEGARYRQAGFSGYLVHPIREAVLREALAKCLGASEAGMETGMLTIHSLGESRTRMKADSSLAAYAGRRALLVEDNVINQRVAAAILKKLGIAVDVAGDGLAALDAVGRESYDIIFMDCQMPRMDGLEATRRIRSGSSAAQTRPVIAMTAHAMETDRQKCLDAGMDDYLSKPISIQDLSAVLERHLASESY